MYTHIHTYILTVGIMPNRRNLLYHHLVWLHMDHTHIQAHTHTHTHILTVHTVPNRCIYIYIYIYIHIHIYIHTHTHIYIYIHTQAMHALGYAYMTGEGEKKNAQEAKKWFEKAAEGGLPDSLVNLGNMYMTGDIGERVCALIFREICMCLRTW